MDEVRGVRLGSPGSGHRPYGELLDEEHVDVDLGNRTVTVVVRRRIVDDDTIDERYYIDGRLVVQRKAFRRPQKVWRAAKSGDGVIYAQ